MIRAAVITSVMLICTAAGLLMSGRVFSVVEKNAFGNDIKAFEIYEKDVYGFFGKRFSVPIITFAERVEAFVYTYAPGIIKLLGFAIDGVGELISKIVYKTVSSLR